MTDIVKAAHAAVELWDRERRELVKKQVCPSGISDAEFEVFMLQCIRSGLDPLVREAFCVPRNMRVKDRFGKDSWVTKHEFQPSEAGMLSRASDFPDFEGVVGSPVYAHELEAFRLINGQDVAHERRPMKGEVLVGAWARGVRTNHIPVASYLPLENYIQDSPLWKKMPATMILKCSRVDVLRKLFPKQFGGLYVPEEMQGDVASGNVGPVQVLVEGFKPPELEDAQLELPTSAPAGDDEPPHPADDEDDLGRLTPAEQILLDIEDFTIDIQSADDVAKLHVVGKRLSVMPKEDPVRKAVTVLYQDKLKELKTTKP